MSAWAKILWGMRNSFVDIEYGRGCKPIKLDQVWVLDLLRLNDMNSIVVLVEIESITKGATVPINAIPGITAAQQATAAPGGMVLTKFFIRFLDVGDVVGARVSARFHVDNEQRLLERIELPPLYTDEPGLAGAWQENIHAHLKKTLIELGVHEVEPTPAPDAVPAPEVADTTVQPVPTLPPSPQPQAPDAELKPDVQMAPLPVTEVPAAAMPEVEVGSPDTA